MKTEPFRLLAVTLTLSLPAAAVEPTSPGAFLDPEAITLSSSNTERPGAATIAWARAVVEELGVRDLPPGAAAAEIAHYIHREFAFTPDRPDTVDAFVEAKAGNCYGHARLGVLLLRLAGIPAKFAYEIHLEHKTSSSAVAAREREMALFGRYHNDHFWVLFYDGKEWLPFDSALGIAGVEEFVAAKYLRPEGGVSNPPFVIWEDQGQGRTGMRNVTRDLWTRLGAPSIPGLPRADWEELLARFADVSLAEMLVPIQPPFEEAIARAGRRFFALPRLPLGALDGELRSLFAGFDQDGRFVYVNQPELEELAESAFADGAADRGLLLSEMDVALHPASAWAHELLGDAYQRAGRGDEALRAYRWAAELDPGDEELREKVERLASGAGAPR